MDARLRQKTDGQPAVGTHPTGMHSCLHMQIIRRKKGQLRLPCHGWLTISNKAIGAGLGRRKKGTRMNSLDKRENTSSRGLDVLLVSCFFFQAIHSGSLSFSPSTSKISKGVFTRNQI